MLSRTISGLAPSRNIWLECMVRKLRKYPLSLESAESESLQNLFANIRGQIGFRVRTCDICHRRAYACVHRACKIGVDVTRRRPAEHRAHTRDVSPIIDTARRDSKALGI